MAVPLRGENPALGYSPLTKTLREESYRFKFFQAVRVLERWHVNRQPLGLDVKPDTEAVRFHAHLSMTFPPSEVVELELGQLEDASHMTVAFLGLTGPSGALPRHYTELLMVRARAKDSTLREFLDLFNHRLISLFYRAWEKNRFWTGFERAQREAREKFRSDPRHYRGFVLEGRARRDLFSQCLLDLGGLGGGGLRYRHRVEDRLDPRTALDDETLRFYGGLLANQHRSAVGLEGILADYFGLPVEVRQFCGQWLHLEPENQTSLVEGGNIQLGTNVVVGERFWDVQGRFRVRLGPLTYKQFLDFLPCGTAFRPLAHLARLYAGQQFDFDVQVVLLAAEVPCCRLTSSAEHGGRLGWNTWIRNRDCSEDATDAVFIAGDN